MQKEVCLEEYVNFIARHFQGSVSTLPDGHVETEEYHCGRQGCNRTCILKGEVKNGRVAKVEKIFGGGRCLDIN